MPRVEIFPRNLETRRGRDQHQTADQLWPLEREESRDRASHCPADDNAGAQR
jgi:hypothetical protein